MFDIKMWKLEAVRVIAVIVYVAGGYGGVEGGTKFERPVDRGALQPVVVSNGVNLPDYIQSSISAYCEKCSDSQRKKVEQVLQLLFSLNRDLLQPTDRSSFSTSLPLHDDETAVHLIKKTHGKLSKAKLKLRSTSPKAAPVDASRRVILPTPEFRGYHRYHDDDQEDYLHPVIAFPTVSTTPPSTTPPYHASHFYNHNRHHPSTTVSAPPDPVQSVEMPTPPMPPTTTLPIYFYYLSSSPPSLSSSSSSLQPPKTPVVESSVSGSKSTTIRP